MIEKRNFFIIIILAIQWFNAKGQLDIGKNLNISEANQPVIAMTNLNVVYSGIENPVAVAIPNVSSHEIYVMLDSGTVKGTNGNYIIIPGEISFARLYIYSIVKGDTTYYGQYGLRVRKLPNPIAYVAGFSDTAKVVIGELLTTNGVVSKFDDFDFDLKSIVISFELKAIVNNQEIILRSKNNILTDEMRNIIKNANGSSIFVFQNIRAKIPDNSIRKLNQVVVKIK